MLWKDIPHHLACAEIQHRNANAPLTDERTFQLALAAVEDEEEAEKIWAKTMLDMMRSGAEIQ